MNISKALLAIFILGSSHSAFAQSILNVCLNKTTQRLTARASCASTETVVTGKNLATATATPAASTSINFAACYQTSAKKSGSTFNGRIAVGVLCKQKTDLLLNDQFSSTDSTGAKPVLESKSLVITGKIPNGVDYGMIATGGANKFYEVQITATCCPIVTTK